MKETIEFDLPDDFKEKVEKLRVILGFDSNAELLYYAVTLLNQITEEQRKGNVVKIPPLKKYSVSGSTSTIKGEF